MQKREHMVRTPPVIFNIYFPSNEMLLEINSKIKALLKIYVEINKWIFV
jgi:hypothetical protein